VGVVDVGLYISLSFGCQLSGGMEQYKYAETSEYFDNDPI